MSGAGEPAAGGPRRPPAVQLGYLWGAAAAAPPLLAALVPGLLARIAPALPRCPVKALTGVPCPGCGSGRATLALARLDLPAAFAANPLYTLAAFAFFAGGLVALGLALSGRGVPEAPRRLPVALRAGVVAVVALNWAWLVMDGR